MSRILVLIPLAIVFLVVAPLQAALALGVAGVVVLVGGYAAVAAVTAAVVLPILIAGHTGVRAPQFAGSILAAALVVAVHRASFRRLRAGQEPRIGTLGNAPLAPDERPGVGWWAKPAPHGLLGRSAMSVGAVLTIIAAIGVCLALAARFA